ncbi:hypothetical protein [Bradyrhizobium iriomotense]|uniref:Uncharacterized protein n=1 Tax=Bradyrhizobium iriomotense TaxID=441950 RepID=A0ABQ6AY71_9BRAD|nr:hypothetical protein [Bradyrhizobium iriomotense]GLR86486.1 hypothetical protein GCM10007857_31970 [Bradyrhizobium iriomotense]
MPVLQPDPAQAFLLGPRRNVSLPRSGSPATREDGIIGYYDLVSMTLITMQAEAPNDSTPPLPPLAK